MLPISVQNTNNTKTFLLWNIISGYRKQCTLGDLYLNGQFNLDWEVPNNNRDLELHVELYIRPLAVNSGRILEILSSKISELLYFQSESLWITICIAINFKSDNLNSDKFKNNFCSVFPIIFPFSV